MSKTLDKHEGPLDIFFYYICDKVSPLFYKTGHTPNMITTYSLITGLLAIYYLVKKRPELFLTLFTVSYFFDCLDGFYARKYKMTSKFGDIYDHFKDIFVHVLLAYFVLKMYYNKIKVTHIFAIIILLLLMSKHLGCQYKILDKKEESLYKFAGMCDSNEQVSFTRYFSPATFELILGLYIYYLATN
jgi:phosphatidylglycerophosphate synthase